MPVPDDDGGLEYEPAMEQSAPVGSTYGPAPGRGRGERFQASRADRDRWPYLRAGEIEHLRQLAARTTLTV